MGNPSVKKTNQMLDQQQQLTRGYGDKNAAVSDDERLRNQGITNQVMSGIGSQWNDVGNATGSFHDPYMSESQPFYRNAMNTGLFDEGQKNDFRARGALQNTALFSGLKRKLDQSANIRGGGFAGYSGQQGLLQRDTARQAEENRLGTEGSLQDMIRKNQFAGAQGVTGNDNTYQGLLQSSDQMKNQFGLAQQGQKTGLLSLLAGLRGNDLGYAQLAGNEYGQGLNAINSRQQETPWWQTAIGAASGIAGTALPFFTGMPKKPGNGYGVTGV